jgi:hypothetical protein
VDLSNLTVAIYEGPKHHDEIDFERCLTQGSVIVAHHFAEISDFASLKPASREFLCPAPHARRLATK